MAELVSTPSPFGQALTNRHAPRVGMARRMASGARHPMVGAVGRTSLGFALAVGRARQRRPAVRFDELNTPIMRPPLGFWRHRSRGIEPSGDVDPWSSAPFVVGGGDVGDVVGDDAVLSWTDRLVAHRQPPTSARSVEPVRRRSRSSRSPRSSADRRVEELREALADGSLGADRAANHEVSRPPRTSSEEASRRVPATESDPVAAVRGDTAAGHGTAPGGLARALQPQPIEPERTMSAAALDALPETRGGVTTPSRAPTTASPMPRRVGRAPVRRGETREERSLRLIAEHIAELGATPPSHEPVDGRAQRSDEPQAGAVSRRGEPSPTAPAERIDVPRRPDVDPRVADGEAGNPRRAASGQRSTGGEPTDQTPGPSTEPESTDGAPGAMRPPSATEAADDRAVTATATTVTAATDPHAAASTAVTAATSLRAGDDGSTGDVMRPTTDAPTPATAATATALVERPLPTLPDSLPAVRRRLARHRADQPILSSASEPSGSLDLDLGLDLGRGRAVDAERRALAQPPRRRRVTLPRALSTRHRPMTPLTSWKQRDQHDLRRPSARTQRVEATESTDSATTTTLAAPVRPTEGRTFVEFDRSLAPPASPTGAVSTVASISLDSTSRSTPVSRTPAVAPPIGPQRSVAPSPNVDAPTVPPTVVDPTSATRVSQVVSPAMRFLAELDDTALERPQPLPVVFRPIAEVITGGRSVRMRTDAAARAALRSVGKVAATTDDVIHLDTEVIDRTRVHEVVAHELTHVAHPSPTPRFFDDDVDSPEERRAHLIGQLMASAPPAPARASAVAGHTVLRRSPSRHPSTGGGDGPGSSIVADDILARLRPNPARSMPHDAPPTSSSPPPASTIRRRSASHAPVSSPMPQMAPAHRNEFTMDDHDPSPGGLRSAHDESEWFCGLIDRNLDHILRRIEDRMISDFERRGGRHRNGL